MGNVAIDVLFTEIDGACYGQSTRAFDGASLWNRLDPLLKPTAKNMTTQKKQELPNLYSD